jgi:hypothetical protein
MSLSEQERKAYELYLFSTSDEEKQTALKMLIPGSERYYHLYLLDVLKTKGTKLNDDD